MDINALLLTVFASFVLANMAWTLEMLTAPGELLERYGQWLTRKYSQGDTWVKIIGFCAPCTTFWLCVAVSIALWLDNAIPGSYAVCMPLIGLFWIRRVLV